MTQILTRWCAACCCLHCWHQGEKPVYQKGCWCILFEPGLEADKVENDVLVGDVHEFMTVRERLVQVAPMIDGMLHRGPAFSTC